MLRQDVYALPEKHLMHDYQMCHEFRVAMIRLCQSFLDPNGMSPVPADVIKEWLRGGLQRMAGLKPAPIFQKVARQCTSYALVSIVLVTLGEEE
jgi:hypothetical protein